MLFSIEYYLYGNDGILLPYVYSLSLGFLMLSSLPVHRQWYLQDNNNTLREYISSVTKIALLTSALAVIVTSIVSSNRSYLLIVPVVFCIEKFCDEVQRRFEFQKNWNAWFVCCIFRYAWPILPITIAYIFFVSYQLVVGIIGALIVLCILVLTFSSYGLPSLAGWGGIYSSLKFLPLNANSAMVRQFSRYFLFSFSGLNAYYLALVYQAGGILSMLVHVALVIPRRKLIARRGRQVFKVLKKTFDRIFLLGLLLGLIALALSTIKSEIIYALILIESVFVGVNLTLLGSLIWRERFSHALVFSSMSMYVACVSILISFGATYYVVLTLVGNYYLYRTLIHHVISK